LFNIVIASEVRQSRLLRRHAPRNDTKDMSSQNFEQLEQTLKTLGSRADLSYQKKQAIRDKVFRAIGQVELADAIVEGEAKANALFVSLKQLQRALIPHRLSFSMPVTLGVVVIVFLASLATGAAAQGAGPSDALFWAKRVLEKVELAFATDPVSRAKVSLNIAGERLRSLEGSLGEAGALEKVLKESQVALVSAKDALQKAKDANTDTSSIEELVNRFSTLLGDQKALLADIEKNSQEEGVKKAVLAIREALEEKGSKEEQPVAAVAPVTPAPTVAAPTPSVSLSGRQTVVGKIMTYYGQPAVAIQGNYYVVTSAPINLVQYVGTDNVMITADFSGNQAVIYQISVNGIVYGSTTP
jgi:hypothetical protein